MVKEIFLCGHFVGLVVGLLTLVYTNSDLASQYSKLSSEEFREQFPDNDGSIIFILGWQYFGCFCICYYSFPSFGEVGDNNLYLATFLIGGGLSILHGIVEIISFVSMRNFSRGGSATYLVDDSIRRFGWSRIGAVILLALLGTLLSIVLG